VRLPTSGIGRQSGHFELFDAGVEMKADLLLDVIIDTRPPP
jgi:hypothetical protein